MNEAPLISVVMAAYNEEVTLPSTLDSILNQREVNIELIVVDDGSTDRTGEILRRYVAQDCRIRHMPRTNEGLTKALIAGCAAAHGELIARQDAGDISLPGRLSHQSALFTQTSDCVLAACGARFRGPNGEFLYEITRGAGELSSGLSRLSLAEIKGPPHHGTAMFKRSAYLAAGGYRAVFEVAQDLDLWLRLSELGACMETAEVLYEASLRPGSISSNRRAEQIRTTETILDCSRARRAGLDESASIAAFLKAKPRDPTWMERRVLDVKFHYFLAAVLRRNSSRAALYHYWRSFRALFALGR